MRVIGMDIHRSFAQIAVLENGDITRQLRVDLLHGPVTEFAKILSREDDVVLEATGNSAAVERLIRPHVRRVVVANSRLVRAIAYARVKTDKIDAAILAKLHAAGFLPEVWVADDTTLSRRRQVAERMGVLEQLVRTKGRIQSILHSNLIPKYKGHLFGKAGRKWLDGLPLPDEERALLGRLMDELERVSAQLAELAQVLAAKALDDRQAKRLMTIPGVSYVVASTVLASIGDVSRFKTPQKLSSYIGLTPKVRQSGDGPARHGRISKQGKSAARKMLVEAAWSAKTAPGPLRAFFTRVQKKRGSGAAAVATARKLAVMIWHVLTGEQEYAFARPAFTDEAQEGCLEDRRATRIRQGRARAGLLDRGDPAPRDGLRRACRTSLRTDGGRLAREAAKIRSGMTNGASQHHPCAGRRGRRAAPSSARSTAPACSGSPWPGPTCRRSAAASPPVTHAELP